MRPIDSDGRHFLGNSSAGMNFPVAPRPTRPKESTNFDDVQKCAVLPEPTFYTSLFQEGA
jgi:hypothetical protein